MNIDINPNQVNVNANPPRVGVSAGTPIARYVIEPYMTIEETEDGALITVTSHGETTAATVYNGPQGERGETGPQGHQGEKGDTGEKGDQGSHRAVNLHIALFQACKNTVKGMSETLCNRLCSRLVLLPAGRACLFAFPGIRTSSGPAV